jgi:HlyD family secretion protein
MTRPLAWTIRVGTAAVIIGGIAWALRPRPIVVETAQAERGTLEATVTAEGKTRVKNLFVVAAPVDGELERIPFKAGQVIDPSTVVARIWPVASRPLDARSRSEALAAVSVARAAVQRAEAALHEAEAALTHTQSTRDTAEILAKSGAGAPKDFEHAEHEVEIRRQAVKESQAAVETARAEVVRAEAAAAPSSTDTSRAVTLLQSPAPGQILRVVHESAGPVTAGTPLVEIGNTSAIEIAADFLTTDAMVVQSGARARIRDWGGPEPLAARVRHVEPGAFTKTSALGLEEQRVSIVLDLVGEQPATFGHDFHVNVDIVVWTGDHVLTIPSTALFRVGDSWAVFAVREGRAHLTKVSAGRSDATRTVVERGLNVGEQVVVQPSDALHDGSRVGTRQQP